MRCDVAAIRGAHSLARLPARVLHIRTVSTTSREEHEHHLNRLQAPRSHEETERSVVVVVILDLALLNRATGNCVIILLVVHASLARPHNQCGNEGDDGEDASDEAGHALAHQQDRQDHRHKREEDGDDGEGGGGVHDAADLRRREALVRQLVRVVLVRTAGLLAPHGVALARLDLRLRTEGIDGGAHDTEKEDDRLHNKAHNGDDDATIAGSFVFTFLLLLLLLVLLHLLVLRARVFLAVL